MNSYHWTSEFHRIFNKGIDLYREGRRDPEAYFDPDDLKFMGSIGCNAQELYDFVEDSFNHGDPDYGTVLLITAVRRDYFIQKQHSTPSGTPVPTSTLHAKTDQIDGIAWLPRIIQKARLKLEGRMAKDLMYGCGGDRRFLKEYNLHPADFLRQVWAAGDNDQKIIDLVKKSRP